MKQIHVCIGILAMSLMTTYPVAADSPPPAQVAQPGNTADHQAIEALLSNYTRCLNQNDEAGFQSMLLDENIPFAAVKTSTTPGILPDLHRYQDFRKAVFLSGQRFKQRFYNIHIEQQGPLAQVSLTFVTDQISGKPQSATGWKVLQLVKVGGRWKIASELYTFEN
jgi:hypothetical protein